MDKAELIRQLAKKTDSDTLNSVRAFARTVEYGDRSWRVQFRSQFQGVARQMLVSTEGACRTSVAWRDLMALCFVEQPSCIECGHRDWKLLPSKPGVCEAVRFCSKRCVRISEALWAERRETTRERFGTDNVFASEQFKGKAKDLYRKALGVDNPSKARSVKAKKAATCLEHFGAGHHMKSASYMEGSSTFTREHYRKMAVAAASVLRSKNGSSNPMDAPGARRKHDKTMLRNHGVVNPFHSETIQGRIQANQRRPETKAALVEKHRSQYGVNHPRQRVETFSATVGKKVCYFKGKELRLDGYEPMVVKFLEQHFSDFVVTVDRAVDVGVRIRWVDTAGGDHVYFPDLAVQTRTGNVIIEVKPPSIKDTSSANTYRCFRAAEQACKKVGCRFILATCTSKGVVTLHHRPSAFIKTSIRAAHDAICHS